MPQILKNKRKLVVLAIVAVLLLIPLIAMQITKEVQWSFFDFVLMAILLLATGFSIEFFTRKGRKLKYKIVFVILILLAFFLVWAELAVGIFGSPFAGS